jgi:DNA-binding transcriptional MerR regulator
MRTNPENQAVRLVEPMLVDVPAAAQLTGTSIGTIRRWVADGLPHIRAGAGGKKLFEPVDLQKWIARLKESAEVA